MTQLLIALNTCLCSQRSAHCVLGDGVVAQAVGMQLLSALVERVTIPMENAWGKNGSVRLVDDDLRFVPRSAKHWHTSFDFTSSMVEVIDGRDVLQMEPPVERDIAKFRKTLAVVRDRSRLQGLSDALQAGRNANDAHAAIQAAILKTGHVRGG